LKTGKWVGKMKCRSCGEQNFVSILDLGDQPWCNDFLTKEQCGKEKFYPLHLKYCKVCELLQIDHTVPKETMFLDHKYVSGTTKTLQKHFFDLAKENSKQFNLKDGDLVVDIGGNDGTQLLQYKKLGINSVLNVESAIPIAKISENNNVPVVNEFFNENTVERYIGKNCVKLINAAGVFFHLEELHSVVKGIKKCLQGDGVFIVQFMYAGKMVDNLNFDTIYHEHLCYYTLRSLTNLLKPYGLEIFDANESEIHSGSIIAKICHSHSSLNKKTERFKEVCQKDEKYTLNSFIEFGNKIKNQRHALKNYLKELKGINKTIYAYGAPAKGNTLLNYFGIANDLIDKAVEVNEMKLGHYLPQSHIPITLESKQDLPDYYLLLSHNFTDEIINKNQDTIQKGTKFIIPFPTIKVIQNEN